MLESFGCSNKPGGSVTGPIGDPKFSNIEVADKYILVNFQESGFSGSKLEFRAKGMATAETSNPGKDITVKITSPSQKIEVNPGSGYNIQIVDLTSGTEKILYNNEVTTYLFYEEFPQNESLPANADQAENTVPWKDKWTATWNGHSDWNHAMNGSFRNIELKKEGDVDFIRLKASKSGENDNTSVGAGIQTAHMATPDEAPEMSKRVNAFSFTYGKVIFRARLDKNNIDKAGPFPALWLVPATGDDSINKDWRKWPVGGEIDVMEHVKSIYGKVVTTVHFSDTPGLDKSSGNGGRNFQKELEAGEWIEYIFEWTKDGLYFYVNGQKVHEYLKQSKPYTEYPFIDPFTFSIIMNVGVGRENFGFTGGKAPAGLTTYMDVDYVKVMPNKDTVLNNSKKSLYYKNVNW